MYTNCQRGLIFEFLKLSDKFMQKYRVDLDEIPPNHIAIRDRFVIPEQILEKTKLFIYQPLDSKHGDCSTEYILKKLPSDCISISLPRLYFKGYWPQHDSNPFNKGNKENFHGLFPYGDKNVNSMINKGFSQDKILQEISRKHFYHREELLKNIDYTLNELSKREVNKDVKVSDFIRENYRKYRLFHTINHPTDVVGLEVANQILIKLNMPPISQVAKPKHKEVLGGLQVPIYPSVIDGLSLTFVSDSSVYWSKEFARKFTFSEYITQYLEQDIQSHLSSAEAAFNKAESLVESGQISSAISSYKYSAEINPDFWKVHWRLGNALEKHGQPNEAIPCYRKAIKLHSSFPWCHYNLGNILATQRKLDEAISCYQAAIKLQAPSRNFWFHIKLGDILTQQGKHEKAIDNYQIAIEINPNTPNGYHCLGLALAKQQNWDDAIANFLKALQIKPGLIPVYYDLGYALEKKGLLEDAKACYTHRNLPVNFIKKYLNSSHDWSVTQSYLRKDLWRTQVYPKEITSLSPPGTVDGNLHFVHKQLKAIAKEAFVVNLPNGRGWSDGSASAIITQDNQLLEDVSTGGARLIAASDNLSPAHKLNGKVVFLSTFFGTPNYCHWMFDTLPRIELMRLAGIDINTIDKFVMHMFQAPFHLQTLNLLGIPKEKVIDTKNHPHIIAENLIVPSVFMHPANAASGWVIEFLRKLVLGNKPVKTHRNKRIYISRTGASKRRIINIEEVENLLDNYGFQTVKMDSMSVVEQAILLSEAEAVVGTHGAGLTNIVFCSPGTKVVEIFSPLYGTNAYFVISNQCGLDYSCFVGEDYDRSLQNQLERRIPNSTHGAKDIFIDIKSLSNLLDSILCSKSSPIFC
ncbi:MAG: WcbI family polysaccharide biosynthesis putative acetyltransferase [Trichodesmium sp. MO_231.B1]|nr:WcbI family polysaccharide biosynthesis putative acetyltransferase [Trichodesmium sp. MO_231.B1]